MCDPAVQLPPPQVATMQDHCLCCHTNSYCVGKDINQCHSATNEISTTSRSGKGIWTPDEHDRFLQAMKAYPNGPWKLVAKHVGTRSVRQVQTHAQKYRQKIARRVRGLMRWKSKVSRPEHRIDVDTIKICSVSTSQVANAAMPPSPTTPAIDGDTIDSCSVSTSQGANVAMPPSPTTRAIDFALGAISEQPQIIYTTVWSSSRIATDEEILLSLLTSPAHPAAAHQPALPPAASTIGFDESIDNILSFFQ